MSWKHLLAARKIHSHQSSKQELDDLRAIIRRDLSDASIPVLSEDRNSPQLTTRRCKLRRWLLRALAIGWLPSLGITLSVSNVPD